MADYFVPANIFQGRGAAESPGTGDALGDIPVLNFLGNVGVDWIPNGVDTGGGAGGGINHMSIGVMASDADGDSDKEQPAAFLAAFKRMGAGGGQTVIPVQGGAPLTIPQCCYTGPMASGNFYISPSDVGPGPYQVIPDPSFWSREVLAPHPSVFVRSPSHCRAISSQLAGDDGAGQMNSGVPSVQVWTVNTQPTFSTWSLVIDGGAQAVVFPHVDGAGAAVDVRRPRDIWAQIVMPELQRRIAQAEPMPLYRDAGGGTVINRGYLSRLNYVSYARFSGYDNTTQLTPLYIPNGT